MALLRSICTAAGAAALAALAGACDFVHPPTYVPGDPDQLLVHAVLSAGSDSAAVLVTRVGRDFAAPVAGAQVRVIGSGGPGVLVELKRVALPCGRAGDPLDPVPQPTGCYVGTVPGGIRTGAEYRLEVDVPGGERVRGRTVVPAPPVVHAPVERLRVQGETTPSYTRSVSPVTVRWTAAGPVSLTAGSGRVWAPGGAAPVTCFVGLEGGAALESVQADSQRVAIYVQGCSIGPGLGAVDPDSLEVIVNVTAYDSAAAAYGRERDSGNGIPSDDAAVGLEGAFGLFGSAARSQRRIILITR